MKSIASRMSVMSGEGALSVYARAKELESQGRSIIHLELGEPDFDPGASVIQILLEDAGVAAIPGAAFGAAGKDFVRFSFASSTATLREAVERIMNVSAAWQGTLAGR